MIDPEVPSMRRRGGYDICRDDFRRLDLSVMGRVSSRSGLHGLLLVRSMMFVRVARAAMPRGLE